MSARTPFDRRVGAAAARPIVFRTLHSFRCLLFVSAAALAIAAVPANAQSLKGKVTDPQDAVVAGADIRLSGTTLAAPRTARSAEDGTFQFEPLTPGRYVLQVDTPGFASFVRDLDVPADGITIDVLLQIPGFTEDVSVASKVSDSSLTKSSVPLRDLPMNVSVVSSRYLEAFAVNDLIDALARVPNINAYQQYGVYEYYQFRGFDTNASMVDGVRNEGNRVRTQLSNVERIEVLKGPAAVLSGTEAIGSAVNIVLKKPSSRPLYEAYLAGGSFDTTRVSGGVSRQLGHPSVLFRVDAGIDKADNFRHDPWTKVNVTPTVTWQPTASDRFEVRYSYDRNDLSGDSGIPVLARADGSLFIPDVPRDRRYNTPQDFAVSEDHNVRVSYTRTLGNHLGFRNVFAPRYFDDEYWVAESMSVPTGSTTISRTFLYFKHRRRPWTNQAELNGSVRWGVLHNFLIGWEHQDYATRTTRSNAANITTTPIDVYFPVETHKTWTDFTVSRYDYTDNFTEGLYVQDHVELGPKVKVIGMFRGDYVNRETHNNPVNNGVETDVAPTKTEQRRVTGRGGMVYQPIERLDLYAQYATSYKPNFNLQPDGRELKPEIGGQWEAGQRFRWLSSRVYLNAAAFRIERRNVTLSLPGGYYDQAGKVRSQGLEVEAEGSFSKWYATLGYGYTDTKYVDYVTTASNGVQTVLSGKTRPRVPRNTFTYEVVRTFGERVTLAASGRSFGDQFLNDANTIQFEGYSLLNLSASLRHGPVRYGLVLSNLTDTEYWASQRGSRLYYPGEGRRIMATLRVSN